MSKTFCSTFSVIYFFHAININIGILLPTCQTYCGLQMLFEFKLKAIIHKNTPNIHKKVKHLDWQHSLGGIWREYPGSSGGFKLGCWCSYKKMHRPVKLLSKWPLGWVGGDQSYWESFFNWPWLIPIQANLQVAARLESYVKSRSALILSIIATLFWKCENIVRRVRLHDVKEKIAWCDKLGVTKIIPAKKVDLHK